MLLLAYCIDDYEHLRVEPRNCGNASNGLYKAPHHLYVHLRGVRPCAFCFIAWYLHRRGDRMVNDNAAGALYLDSDCILLPGSALHSDLLRVNRLRDRGSGCAIQADTQQGNRANLQDILKENTRLHSILV